jgi:hypothetical protein
MSAKTSLHTISLSSFSSASVAKWSLRRTSLARRSCTAAATPELRRTSTGGDDDDDDGNVSKFAEEGSASVFLLSGGSGVFLRWKILAILPMFTGEDQNLGLKIIDRSSIITATVC